MFRAQLIFEKMAYPGCPFSHVSNLTQLDENTLMAQWYSGWHEEANNQAIFGAKYNIKEGAWSKPFLLSKSTRYPEGNGVIWKDPGTGKLFLFHATIWTTKEREKALGRGWYRCKVFYMASNDDGASWGERCVLMDELGYNVRHVPIVLADGRMLLPMYHEYPAHGIVAISDNRGETFHFSQPIKNHDRYTDVTRFFVNWGNIQPTLAELSDSSILALLRTRRFGKVFRSVSTDRGETWSPAEETGLLNPDEGICMVKLKSGRLVLIFNNSSKSVHGMWLAACDDGKGLSWTVVKRIEQDPRLKLTYPSIMQARDGTIHATYTWDRKSIKHVYFDEDWLVSGD
nr:sialidase family protein [Candidatus Sigynarchaeota archaeon]